MALLFFVFLSVFKISSCLSVVHVVPHSHCDAGYRKSFEQYYEQDVGSIISTVLICLKEGPNRKFVWEEVSFLQRWWNDASDDQKELMRQLIKEGRLEMIGGGWTMHDEAVNDARTIVNQMTLGLQFLQKNLNTRPKYDWHIDPFGHSIMMPELYHALQYDAIVLNRIPNPIKQQMKMNKTLEFNWTSPFTNISMFTHVLGAHYSTPKIIGIDIAQKAQSLIDTCRKRMKWYKTEHLLLPFGNDFAFKDATKDFQQMEEIMSHINDQSGFLGLEFHFSTLNDYFTVIQKDGVDFPSFNGVDFFPYIACYPCNSEKCANQPCSKVKNDTYWSGYFTSKPAQKLLIRQQETVTSVLDTLNSLHPFNYSLLEKSISVSHTTSALLTHHDAITGTSFSSSYEDYNLKLEYALGSGEEAIGILKSMILCKRDKNIPLFTTDIKDALAHLSNTNMGVIVVYNPSDKTRSDYVMLELPEGLCIEVFSTFSQARNKRVMSQQVQDRFYIPLSLPPLGMQTLYLQKTKCGAKVDSLKQVHENFNITNEYIKLYFNSNNHLISLTDVKRSSSLHLSIELTEILESIDEKPFDSVCDGTNVYTFVPMEGSNSSRNLLPDDKNIDTVLTADGPLVWEVQQQISTETCPIKTTMRLFHPLSDLHKQFIEIQNTIGSLSSSPNSILFSLKTSLESEEFITYTSGIYPMTRSYDNSKPFQGNFYPLVGRVSMIDQSKKEALVVSTQRPMAVSADQGTLNLLVHRRIPLLFDQRGNDTSVMNDHVLVGMIPTDDVVDLSYEAMSYCQSPFSVHVAVIDSQKKWTDNCQTEWNPVKESLPKNVHLLSMQLLNVISDKVYQIGIRLLNTNQEQAVSVDLDGWLKEWRIHSANETTPDFGVMLKKLSTTKVKLTPYKLASFTTFFARDF